MTLGDLSKMSREDRAKLCPGTKCNGNCGNNVNFVNGCNRTSDGLLCDDCYYERLGEIVEQCPIGIPRMHRGA